MLTALVARILSVSAFALRKVRGLLAFLRGLFTPRLPRRVEEKLGQLAEGLPKAIGLSDELYVIERRRGLPDAPHDLGRIGRLINFYTTGKGRLQLRLDGRLLTAEEMDNLIWSLWNHLRPFSDPDDGYRVWLFELVEEILEFLSAPPGFQREEDEEDEDEDEEDQAVVCSEMALSPSGSMLRS